MIKLLRSGNWALEGREVVALAEGEEKSFGPSNDFALVEAEWAEWVKPKVEYETKASAKPGKKAD